jgi:hypothetical protein
MEIPVKLFPELREDYGFGFLDHAYSTADQFAEDAVVRNGLIN